ncbi:hypothetical protein TrRE_jg9602 [Triparma retinervis]|uniref:Nudix hydrolase domain-containing protein n=1 Tax=Triparma retinervis TaxID=2557542 RepID=A0A9W7AER2_9STRA|nr:hypothetical protein TrRE_jg9602 [Triparma retinervis]
MNAAMKVASVLPSPVLRIMAFVASLISVTVGTLCLSLDRQIMSLGLPLPLVYSYSLPSTSPARVRISRSSGSSRPLPWGELAISLEDYYNASKRTLTFHEDEDGVVISPKSRSSASVELPHHSYITVSKDWRVQKFKAIMRGIEDTGKLVGGMKRRLDEGFWENQKAATQGDSGQGNILRLCACAVVRVKVGNKPYVLLTQRQLRKSRDSTFSGMWVFPGGHVDMVEGKMEGLSAAARREVLEETGLEVSGAKKLCTYQASLIHKSRGYLICFFSCDAKAGGFASAGEALSGVCRKEVGAAALIPETLFKHGIFSPELCSEFGSKEAAQMARDVGMGDFDGVLVEGNEIKNKKFSIEEIVGDGGEGARGGGIGMAHRWAAECFRNEGQSEGQSEERKKEN